LEQTATVEAACCHILDYRWPSCNTLSHYYMSWNYLPHFLNPLLQVHLAEHPKCPTSLQFFPDLMHRQHFQNLELVWFSRKVNKSFGQKVVLFLHAPFEYNSSKYYPFDYVWTKNLMRNLAQ
jgi:hypothetical protein